MVEGFNLTFSKTDKPGLEGTYILRLSKEMLAKIINHTGDHKDVRKKTQFGYIQINYHEI